MIPFLLHQCRSPSSLCHNAWNDASKAMDQPDVTLCEPGTYTEFLGHFSLRLSAMMLAG